MKRSLENRSTSVGSTSERIDDSRDESSARLFLDYNILLSGYCRTEDVGKCLTCGNNQR